MKHYYCSTFSKAYAYKGLLLYNSLLRWDRNFHFFFICLDESVQELFRKMNLRNASIIAMQEIERDDPELLTAKSSRNDKEYIWTAKASVLLYIFKKFRPEHIVWLDGDTYFYGDPEPIFTEWGSYSIMLTEERWSKANRHRIHTRGRYNTGFMGFKRDSSARKCLAWFRKRLLEWCYDRLENGLWSDQLYVNDWLSRFDNVGVIKNLGVNVGPCIIRQCKLTRAGDHLYVNGEKLIFYHSYGFRYYDGNEFDLCSYRISFADNVVRWIYLPYIYACKQMMEDIALVDGDFYPQARPIRQFIRNYFNLEVHEGAGDCVDLCTLVSKDYLVQGLALYNSLRRTSRGFRLWILCVDSTAYTVMEQMNLPDVKLISLENIRNEHLEELAGERQLHEFCWTLKPYLISYLLKNNLNIRTLMYLDADLYFFDDIRKVIEEWGDKPIYLTDLWMGKKWAARVGQYSAGLIGFRRNRWGLKVLKWWRRKCREWCYDQAESGRWADQKYLDQWPRLARVQVADNPGINLGPWNIRKGQVRTEAGKIHFDGKALICYHFSGFRVLGEWEFELCNRRVLPAHATPIYYAYLEDIAEVISRVKAIWPQVLNSTAAGQAGKLYNHHSLEGSEHAGP